jgi:SAM-dependent methyltransferase
VKLSTLGEPIALLGAALRGPATGLGGRWHYLRFLADQVRQTHAKRAKDARFRLVPFVELVRRHCPDLGAAAAILSIGPRNAVELDVLAEAGFPNVTAIDLHSTSPRIRCMDMHRLAFADGMFDLVFASHVLEHAWDIGVVAREITRVLRPGGRVFCAVPRDFEPNWHDRYCFDTAADLLRHFAAASPTVCYEDVRPQELRLLFRVKA